MKHVATSSVVAVLVVASFPPLAGSEELAPECDLAADVTTLTVGVVDCFKLPSPQNLGGDVPVSYFIPGACAGRQCPVLYYLHGTGGSYRSGTGAKGTNDDDWVKALTNGPPVDPRTQPDPWNYGSSTWVPKPAIDMIIVAPHGRTLAGGNGHASDQDMGWFDWNPRYALGGDSERYHTPPPRPSSFLSEELVPFVDSHFPTVAHRQWRAILGYSQGGFGSYINGLTHPDIWSSMGMESGGGLPLVAPGDFVDDSVLVTGVAPPASLPFLRLPGLIPTAAPDPVVAENIVGEAVMGFGDPIADQAWMRASNPIDLIPNARAWGADGRQSNHLKHFVNDAVPRRVEDYTALPDRYMGEVFEALLYPMCLYMEQLFERHEVERTFDIGPGNHWDPYQSPYFREQLEHQYANLRHWDGSIGDPGPRPDPVRFDYRTIRTQFTIWGWSFSVDREAVEFLNLTDVSCSSITMRGTGFVTVTVPDVCGTGFEGQKTFVVDLGPSHPVDEPLGMGTSHAYGPTVTRELDDL